MPGTTTHTGSFPVGFRIRGAVAELDFDQLLKLATDNAFAGVDLPTAEAGKIDKVKAAGLRVGTVDLPQPWASLTSADAAKRKDAAQEMAAAVKGFVAQGVQNFFAVIIVEDDTVSRKENLDRAVDGYGQLCAAIKGTGAHIVLEGWPGGGPRFGSLGCTPESLRAVFGALGTDVLGVNYDPSHLIRMGIDPVRFLHEFIEQVHHVHAKDTLILADDLYAFGHLQSATLATPHGFGEHCWRYCIPGHGLAPWGEILRILVDAKYKGMLCIELEDENFNDGVESETRGLLAARDFLKYV